MLQILLAQDTPPIEMIDKFLQPTVLPFLLGAVGIVVVGTIIVVKTVTRHRERIAMIQQGMNPISEAERIAMIHQGMNPNEAVGEKKPPHSKDTMDYTP